MEGGEFLAGVVIGGLIVEVRRDCSRLAVAAIEIRVIELIVESADVRIPVLAVPAMRCCLIRSTITVGSRPTDSSANLRIAA